jgi:hypothetical protein
VREGLKMLLVCENLKEIFLNGKLFMMDLKMKPQAGNLLVHIACKKKYARI